MQTLKIFGMFRVWVLELELWEVSDFNFRGGEKLCCRVLGPLGCGLRVKECPGD